MLKAYKYKIKPNQQQEELLSRFFGCVRYIYNWGLSRKTSAYKENGKAVNYLQLAKELTALKQTEECSWLNECTASCLKPTSRKATVL